MGQDGGREVGGHKESPSLLSGHQPISVLVNALKILVILGLGFLVDHPLLTDRGDITGACWKREDAICMKTVLAVTSGICTTHTLYTVLYVMMYITHIYMYMY